jgi:hypothetical protein
MAHIQPLCYLGGDARLQSDIAAVRTQAYDRFLNAGFAIGLHECEVQYAFARLSQLS